MACLGITRDPKFMIMRLLNLVHDITSEQGRIIKIFEYWNVMTEVPKSYREPVTILQRIFGREPKIYTYEGLEITHIRFAYQLPDKNGQYYEGVGQIENLGYNAISPMIAFGFEETAYHKGLLQQVTPCGKIKIKTEPDFSLKRTRK